MDEDDQEQPGGQRPGMVRIKLDEQGAITATKIEQYALLLADDVDRNLAWRLLGGLTSGPGSKVRTSRNYRDRILGHRLFKERLAALTAEKEKLMADEPWGEPMWMARQLYRTARTTNDAALMKDAIKEVRAITDKMHQGREPSSDEPARGPGRPVVENPQVKRAPDAIMSRLMAYGRSAEIAETSKNKLGIE